MMINERVKYKSVAQTALKYFVLIFFAFWNRICLSMPFGLMTKVDILTKWSF